MLPICTFISQMSFRQDTPFSINISDSSNCCVQMVCLITLNILAKFELLILNPNISPQKCVSFVNDKSFRKMEATIWNIQDYGSSKKLKRIYVIYVVNIKMKEKVGNSNNRQQEINNLGFSSNYLPI